MVKRRIIMRYKKSKLPLKGSSGMGGLESYLSSTLFERSSILDFQSPKDASGNPPLKKFSLKLDQRFLDWGQALLIGNGDIPWVFVSDFFVLCLCCWWCFVGSENYRYNQCHRLKMVELSPTSRFCNMICENTYLLIIMAL